MEEGIGKNQVNNKTITPVKPRAKEQFPSSFIIEKRRNKEEEKREIKKN